MTQGVVAILVSVDFFFTKRCRPYWMRTSKNARTNQGRGFHVIGVCCHALESRSLELASRNGGYRRFSDADPFFGWCWCCRQQS